MAGGAPAGDLEGAVFDIGAPEVLVLLVVALFVFGPERLPAMARQAGRWLHDLRRMVANARRDLDEQIGLDTSELGLRDLNPRSYIRRNVLDGLDLDGDDEPVRRRSSSRPANRPVSPSTGPSGSPSSGATPPQRLRTGPSARPRTTAQAAGASPAEPAQPQPPPYDPDAT